MTIDDRLVTSTAALLALLSQRGIGHRSALTRALNPPSVEAPSLERVALAGIEDWDSELKRAQTAIERDRSRGIEAIGFFDDRYPDVLRGIADPPAVVWVSGDVELLRERKAVAIVGTREPSKFGVDATREVAGKAAERDWSVISGLAKGVDTIAHESALEAKGKTVAVMAGGLDSIYPAENRGLARRIASEGGALVSETPTGQGPRPSSFIARDRLQVALSQAVVICQTGVKGGALHTARYAATQGLPIFCPYPKEPRTEKSEGLKVLLEEPADSLCDRFREWEGSTSLCRRLGDRPLARPIDGVNGVKELFDYLDRMNASKPIEEPPRRSVYSTDPWWELLVPHNGDPTGVWDSELIDVSASQKRLFG